MSPNCFHRLPACIDQAMSCQYQLPTPTMPFYSLDGRVSKKSTLMCLHLHAGASCCIRKDYVLRLSLPTSAESGHGALHLAPFGTCQSPQQITTAGNFDVSLIPPWVLWLAALLCKLHRLGWHQIPPCFQRHSVIQCLWLHPWFFLLSVFLSSQSSSTHTLPSLWWRQLGLCDGQPNASYEVTACIAFQKHE